VIVVSGDTLSTRTCFTATDPLTGRFTIRVVDDRGQEIIIKQEQLRPPIEDCSNITGWE